MTLTEFLLARIAEDEFHAQAGETKGGNWVQPDDNGWDSQAVECPDTNEIIVYAEGRPTLDQARHIARWDPHRVLAECEAKRRIVEQAAEAEEAHRSIMDEFGGDGSPRARVERAGYGQAAETLRRTLLLLALPYADHADYDESWRP